MNTTSLSPETMRGNWSFPTSVRFGAGRIQELAAACKEVGIKRPLLVTDPGLAKLARIVIADPALTVELPPKITASTGMDALAHNLEAYCAPSHNPFAGGIAVEGMRLVKEYLPAAFADGGDLVARGQMMAASSM